MKLVLENGLSACETSRRLSLAKSTLENWIKASKSGSGYRELSEVELHRLRRELAEVKMERDFLKKAAAYFAT